MAKDQTTIACSECGHQIDVNKMITEQLEESIQKKYKIQLAAYQKEQEKALAEINAMKEELYAKANNISEAIKNGVKEKIKNEKEHIEKSLRAEIADEKAAEIDTYKKQLKLKSEQVIELNKTKAEIENLKREKDELKSTMEAAMAKEFSQKLNEERQKIQKETDEKVEMKLNEKELVILQLHEQLKSAQRKAEQGSSQLQGEAQELAIENWLSENFPLDEIHEIKKGARGADCLHIIKTRTRDNCGSVYYESKRAKDFNMEWVEKMKLDMQEKSATFGVIVTENLPKNTIRMHQVGSIWICTYNEFKWLCNVLRESVILLDTVKSSQENKGDKMVLLYDFLSGQEFRMQMEAIVDGFSQLQDELNSEKRAMEKIWKQREKQIQKVTINTSQMYGVIRGIAGNAVGSIKALELPEPADINLDKLEL